MPGPIIGPLLAGLARTAAGTEAAAFLRTAAPYVLENSGLTNARSITAALRGSQASATGAGVGRSAVAADVQAALSGSGGATTEGLASSLGRELPDALRDAFRANRTLQPTSPPAVDLSGSSAGRLQEFDRLAKATDLWTQTVRTHNRAAAESEARSRAERDAQAAQTANLRQLASFYGPQMASGALAGLTASSFLGRGIVPEGIGQPIKGAAKGAGLMALGAASFNPFIFGKGVYDATTNLAKLPAALAAFGAALVAAQEPARRFSGTVATAFARLEHAGLVRQFDSAATRGGSISRLVDSQIALDDMLRPYRDLGANSQNSLQAAMARLAAVMLAGVEAATPLDEIVRLLNRWLGGSPTNSLPWAQMVKPWAVGNYPGGPPVRMPNPP